MTNERRVLPDGLALAVDHGVRGHDAVRGGVSLHNLHRSDNLGRHEDIQKRTGVRREIKL